MGEAANYTPDPFSHGGGAPGAGPSRDPADRAPDGGLPPVAVDVREWIREWNGPDSVRVVFTRNRTVLASCRTRRRAGGLSSPSREVRLHEIFREAPREVQLAAVATVLRHVSRGELARLRRIFREYVHNEDARFRALSRPSAFARRAPGPRGERHDLAGILERSVASGVSRPHAGPLLLTWTRRPQRRLLGTYEPAGGSDPAIIRVNRALDDPEVPEALVAYVLHHELLHGEMPSTILDGRRRLHPPEFRRREREFPGSKELEEWEKSNFARLLRRSRRRERRRAAPPPRKSATVAPPPPPAGGRQLFLPLGGPGRG